MSSTKKDEGKECIEEKQGLADEGKKAISMIKINLKNFEFYF